MSSQDTTVYLKTLLRLFDSRASSHLDKTSPNYDQENLDRLYIELKRLKDEAQAKLSEPTTTESERRNLEPLIKDIDEHLAMIAPHVSNGIAGGKRRNKKSRCKRQMRTRRRRRRNKSRRNN